MYAQVLAYSVGLGPLVNESKLQMHNAVVERENCARPDDEGKLLSGECPNGLLTYVGRGQHFLPAFFIHHTHSSRCPTHLGSAPQMTDWALWQMVNHDWATIQLRANNPDHLMSPSRASQDPEAKQSKGKREMDVNAALLYSQRSATSWYTLLHTEQPSL